jgi:hypothetical protein
MKVYIHKTHVDFLVPTYETITHTCSIYEAYTNGTHLVIVLGKEVDAVTNSSNGH